jgi:hypothetical protein
VKRREVTGRDTDTDTFNQSKGGRRERESKGSPSCMSVTPGGKDENNEITTTIERKRAWDQQQLAKQIRNQPKSKVGARSLP